MGYFDDIAKQRKTAQETSYFDELARSKRNQNEGGVGGGIGYTLGKLGTGALSILEGATDYTVGGIAKLFGQDEYAEQLFEDDKTGSLNAKLDDWYNPSKTMQVVGDVASGIGNSLVGVGVVAGASLLSGGTLTPTAAALVSGGTIGLGAAGMSTTEAYKKTGQLGAKEFGYGALSGITEAGLEAVSGAAGKVGAKLFAKKTAETVAKSSILKGIAKSFAGEAFEEGMSEFLDPYFQRWTQVDPDAKNATAQEIGYAALIGGISGALLDGVGSSANAIRSTVSGNKIVNTGKTNVVLDTAKEYAKYQEKNNTTNKAYQEIKSMVDEYEALDAKNTSGKPNIRQRRLLGDMQTANTVLAFSPAVEESKARILANAEEFANYLNGLNIKMEDGSVFKTSAEDLRTNDALLTRYAVSDALGHILMDSKSVYDLTMSGDAETMQNKFIGGELAFMRFKEDASDAEIKEVSNLLGLDIKNATYEQYIEKLKTTPAHVFENYRDTLASMTNAKRAIGEAKVKKTDVHFLAKSTKISDGINVFKDTNGNYFAIIREGKTYRIYQDGKLTKEMNKKTLNSLLFPTNETENQAKTDAKTIKEVEKMDTARETVEKKDAGTQVENVETARETLQKTAADNYARKNIKGYDELSERKKIAVRWTIMSGKANGVSDDVITAFARISADTKTNIGFAEGVADGITYTNDGEHTIYLNANGTRTVEKGVMHELTHAMKGTDGYAELQALAEQYFSTHEREYNDIKERYESFYKKNNIAFTDDIISDELTAHFVEKQMESRKVLTRMTEDNPSFMKKCISFLQRIKQHFINGTTSDTDMNNVERKFLSVYNAYKVRQQSKISEKRYSLSSMQKDWGATLEEMESGEYKNKQGYKDTVVDLSINLFDNNKEKYKNLIESRRSVESQIDGIVKVAVAMKKAGLDIEVAEGSDARDTKGRSLFSSLEPNSDYVTSHDISTECNKRESFQEIYEAIIAKDPTFFYDIGNYFVIHDIMAKKGLTTPCRDCYVESMRKNLAPMAESFISMLHEGKKLGKSNAAKRDRMIVSTGEEEVGAAKDGGYIAKYGLTVDYDVNKKNMPLDTKTLNVRMLTTEDGIATLRTLYPEIYEQFNGYYGQAKPKLPRRSAPYRFGELTAMFSTDKGNIKKSLIDKIVAAGGLRFQSYSDFKLKNTTDVLQVILEAESLGLTGQTYTKVPAFLDVVGDTNMKVNISIFTENANEAEELKAKPDPKELTWKLDKLESFPMSIDDIYKNYVQADKNGNTTIIDVVQNVSNAAWAMVNDKIGYVIPYHKSGMQMEFKRNKKGQRTAIDHTAYQNEKIGAKRVKENLSFHKYWWEDWAKKQSQLDNIMEKEGKNGVIKAKLTHYFDECAKDGRKPKFYDIYLAKDITDICKAQAEKLGLNLSDSEIYFEYKAKNGETWKVPYGYYKFLGDYQVFKPDGTESMPLPLTLDGYDFDGLASRFSDKKSIARTELLQQVTDKENFANKSNEEISSEIKKRRQESAEEAIKGKRYALPDTDSTGEKLSKEQQEYFKDSKIVDEDGRLLKVYHGTSNEFTVFDKEKIRAVDTDADYNGFWFSDDPDTLPAWTKLNKRFGGYLNITNPAPLDVIKQVTKEARKGTVDYESARSINDVVRMRLQELGYDGIIHDDKPYVNREELKKTGQTIVTTARGTKYLLRMEDGYIGDYEWHDSDGGWFDEDEMITGFKDVDDFLSIQERVYVAFESNQFKEATNKTPTANPDIRYALPVVSPVEPTSSEWKKTIDTSEAKKRFPKLWDVTADSSEVRNPTQITSTVSSYNKIYDILAKENFTGRILDASSGLGYGTMSGRNNYGFDVDDIEPYPDASYSPKYKDYTKLDQDYDVIISNAVLNVLPQDQRDSLVKTMGDHLNDGGRLFINVRGDDVNSLAKNENNVKIGDMEWYVANTGSYQKGFTNNELVSYLKDALGSGFTVEPTKQFGKVSAIVTKDNSAIRYALPDGIDVNKIEGGDRAMTELPQDRLTLRDVVTDKSKVNAFKSQVSGDAKQFTEGWQIMFTNAQAGIERVIKSAGIKEATAMTNYVRAAKYAGMNAIDEEGGQYTLDGSKRVGDSLVKIWSPIYKGEMMGENYKKNPTKYAKNARYQDYQQKFNLYLLHNHNIDRYAEGKMVLGEDITPEVSEKEIAKMDEAYPEFRAVAEKTWKFTDNLLQLAVDSGMYSQEYVDNLREMYPHYVPTYREEHMNGVRSIFGARDISVNAAKKKAKGADTRVLPIDDVIARMTIQRYSSSRINKLLVDLADGLEKNNVSSDDFRIIASEDTDIDMDNGQLVDTKKTSGGYQVTFYRNGKRVTAEVSKNVFSGIDAFAPSGDTTFHNVLLDGVAKVNTTFKKLVTSLNPFFSYFRNPLRDIQDAGLYTRYPLRTFAKNYARARKEITGNGTYWQEAKAAGITSASVFDYEKGITTKQKNKVQRFLDRVEATSNTIEMTPRLAEYISARESGKSVQEALLEAQDVTTNFGRGGVFAKKLNSTIMPFLNPAIQGFSKMVRAYTGKDAAQSYVNLIVRSIMLGIGMAALNDLMNEDDEDYQDLSDYIKETNYVVALGDGEFLKIPKGRVVGVFGEVYLRSKWYLQGDKKAYDGLLKSFSQQVTPVDNFSRTIFSPIMDLKNNKTWYGGDIESQKWENTKPSDRYDESTSSIAIWLGKVFDYSPLKINYLLDQYGGVVTDIILPATSTQAETGIVSQNLLVNSITNSKWSSKFYDTLEDYNYKKTDGDKVSAGVVKYLNDVRSTISDMNKQISEIQQSYLSDEEKLKQEKIIQAAINALEKDALANVKYLEEELGKYDLSDDTFDADWRDAVSTTIGEEYALKKYNKDVYSKAKTLSTGGIGMGTYYDYYFDVKNIESDKKANGETIAGSKKAKVIAYTWQLNIPDVQKLMLIMSSGYTITDNDVNRFNSVSAKRVVAQYITQLNISKEEKLELARTCGLTVQGNKIIIKNN